MRFLEVIRVSFLFIQQVILGVFLLAACSTPASPIPSPLPPQVTSTANEVRLANGYWPPYDGADLPHYGCDAWIVEEAFALEGITVKYGFFPWVRSYKLSVSGEWDGTLSWLDSTDHRKEHYLSAEPLTTQEFTFFSNLEKPFTGKTLSDLSGKKVGVTTGYFYSDELVEMREKGEAVFIESSSDEANFKMLLAERIDVFLMERRVGHYIIKSIFTPGEQAKIMTSEESFSTSPSYLLLSKALPQNKEKMTRFDHGFKRLQESGRYVEILKSCAP